MRDAASASPLFDRFLGALPLTALALLGGYLMGVCASAQRPPSQRFDTDGDGRIDASYDWTWGGGGRAWHDRNGDRRQDLWLSYADGWVAREERDDDFDGTRDAWVDYTNGEIVRERRDTDGDGNADVTYHFREGVLASADWHPGGGPVARRDLYENGVKRFSLAEPDAQGRFRSRTSYDAFERPLVTESIAPTP